MNAHPMTRTDAERALQEVSAARELTRGVLNASWLALLIWGVIVLASAPFTQIGDGEAVAFYWLVATPLGFLITGRAYRSFELKMGVEDRYEMVYTAIIAAMVIVAVATGVAGQGGMLSAVGPLFAIGLGFIAIASVRLVRRLGGVDRGRDDRARGRFDDPRTGRAGADRGAGTRSNPDRVRRDRVFTAPPFGYQGKRRTMTHPALQLDDTVHQRVRLGILAVLTETKQADFAFVRDALDLTDGNLSRHIAVLEDAGLVTVDKRIEGRRTRTWVSATKAGRGALAEEIKALSALIARVNGSP